MPQCMDDYMRHDDPKRVGTLITKDDAAPVYDVDGVLVGRVVSRLNYAHYTFNSRFKGTVINRKKYNWKKL